MTSIDLVLLLFPQLEKPDDREAFENLLRTVRLQVDNEHCFALQAEARHRPLSRTHAWVRVMANKTEGQSAIFLWADEEPNGLLAAVSSLTTLDSFVSEAIPACKVVVVPDRLWPSAVRTFVAEPGATSFTSFYPTLDTERNPTSQPVLVFRQRSRFGASDVDELGLYLGTRQRRERSIRPDRVSGAPSVREDETVEFATEDKGSIRPRRPSGGVIEAQRLGSVRPDPRCENESERETIEPPPPPQPR